MTNACAANNILVNCDFNDAMTGWGVSFGGAAMATDDTSGSGLTLKVAAPGANPWDIQLYQAGLTLKAGKLYALRFSARSHRAQNIDAHVSLNASPWTKFDNYSPVALTTTPSNVLLAPFSVMSTTHNVKIEIWLGGGNGREGDSVYFDNIQLIETDNNASTQNTLTISGASTKAISPYLFGINYWMWPSSFNGKVQQTSQTINQLNMGAIRMGGAVNDSNNPAFNDSDLIASLNYAKDIGAEAIVQVPVKANTNGSKPTAQTSAEMVSHIRKKLGYDVKYFSIGNEADLYNDGSDALDNCASFKAFAPAMRAADANIKILGPDLAWKYQTYEPYPANDWFTPIVKNCGQHIDIFTVHRYRGGNLNKQDMLNSAEEGRKVIRSLKATMAANGHGAKPLAFTEANADKEWGQTFIGAIWIADSFGVAAEEELWSLMVWSIIEGDPLGVLNQTTLKPHPTYYGFKMVSEHFGDELLTVTEKPLGVSVYASRNSVTHAITLVLINKNAQAREYGLKLEQLTTTAPSKTFNLPAESITTVVIQASGSSSAWQYTQAMADQNSAPQPLN